MAIMRRDKAVEVGTVKEWPTDIAPEPGWDWCDGGTLSRTIHVALFRRIGTRWGQGDGVTTFNKPDRRGVVARGWNGGAVDAFIDPDAATRIARLAGGITGDFVGSYQQDQNKLHDHTVEYPHTYGLGSGPFPYGAGGSTLNGGSGGAEARPKNCTMAYVIRL